MMMGMRGFGKNLHVDEMRNIVSIILFIFIVMVHDEDEWMDGWMDGWRKTFMLMR